MVKKIYEIKNLNFSYGKNKVFEDLNIDIYGNEFIGIVGPNGGGKTTFLKLIAKILVPESGFILYNGKDLKRIKNIEYAKEVAYLPSEIRFTFDITVKDFLLYGRYPFEGRFKKEKEDIIYEVSKNLNIEIFLNKKISQISEGEKQRIFIAQVIVQNPQIILLDEPTSHLDIGYQFQIMDILKNLNEKGKTIISILHDLNLASHYCSKIILFKNCKIYKSGNVEDVLTYQNIEDVYNTKVLVYRNPFTKKINVFGIPSYILHSLSPLEN
ncbi:MAG: ABC transporter ATP-binding protein [bacterium]|nr:ABC transporter ATP-binding protein [bacterium]